MLQLCVIHVNEKGSRVTMFKKIILMNLILMLFTTPSTNTLASQLSETEREKYKQVIAVHGMQIIEEIPDGITPIEVSSPEE